MSQILIQNYLSQLDLIRKVSGSQRETVLREAFKDLLKAWGKQCDLTFLAEYPLVTPAKNHISVDGALLHALRLPLGFWEAKDADDDLDTEISLKFKKGYPQDNIIFSDDSTAVLWQNRSEVLRCDMTDTRALSNLLTLFFSFERPEIAGFRSAIEQFKVDLPAVILALRQMMEREHQSNPRFGAAQARFLTHARESINPALGDAEVREMLIQHILTEEIFAKVFDDSDFHQHNNVARELYALEAAFFTGALKKQTLKSLETYYAAIRATAAQISSHSEKQTFLKIIYENFYRVYNPKAADRLGVVYTPNEIVRFMIDGTDWLCEKYFGKNLIDKDVDILDPATGTGTFICELLEHFRGQPAKLAYKYLHELHANEVAILPYYVANLNIEATFAAITGQYDEFPNLCFVDTLDNVGLHTAAKGVNGDLFGNVSEENMVRIKRQNNRKISIIIGNPPYNANQPNENDNNKNREYSHIDQRIKQTYIAQSTAQKTKLYDMYARFFRWASDRLDDNGILAFVSNRSFIESRTFDGFRKTIAEEFSDIYVVDLGGDVRVNPKLSGTKHNVFGIQTGVAISLMVKRLPSGHAEGKARRTKVADKKPALIHYYRRPEMETAAEKLSFLSSHVLRDLMFEQIKPDKTGNWINLTDNDFETLIPLASKETKGATTQTHEKAIFKLMSNGIVTARDEWMTDFSIDHLIKKTHYFCRIYLAEQKRWEKISASQPKEAKQRAKAIRNFVSREIKWTQELESHLDRGTTLVFDSSRLRSKTAYRPFVQCATYYARALTHRVYRQDAIFPISGDWDNFAIGFSGVASSKPFSTLCVNVLPSFDLLEKTQFVPLYRYDTKGTRLNNITDWAHKQFTAHYKGQDRQTKSHKITKEAIFHYCYAVLHDPIYRQKYAQNLKREFPRIPFYPDLWQWAAWGEALMALHIGYENVTPFALTRTDLPDEKVRASGFSPKPILRSDPDSGSIVIDTETTLHGIPAQAWAYQLGNRCAIDWVLDQYKEKSPKTLPSWRSSTATVWPITKTG